MRRRPRRALRLHQERESLSWRDGARGACRRRPEHRRCGWEGGGADSESSPVRCGRPLGSRPRLGMRRRPDSDRREGERDDSDDVSERVGLDGSVCTVRAAIREPASAGRGAWGARQGQLRRPHRLGHPSQGVSRRTVAGRGQVRAGGSGSILRCAGRRTVVLHPTPVGCRRSGSGLLRNAAALYLGHASGRWAGLRGMRPAQLEFHSEETKLEGEQARRRGVLRGAWRSGGA